MPAFDLPLGLRSQAGDRIGASGFRVRRLRVEHMGDAGSCRLQRRARESCVTRKKLLVRKLLFTLRRSRGATRRYLGPWGGLYTAPDVPRRPTDGPDGFTGMAAREKG